MKRVAVIGPGEAGFQEAADPRPGPRDAVLRVAACGICGTDLRYVRLGGLAGPSAEPMPLGHELSGVVDEVGVEVEGIEPGMRVVLNPTANGNMIGNGGPEGGFAPRLLVRNVASGGSLFPIPAELPFDRAALAEPLGVGMNAVDRAEVGPGDKVAVFGAGPIGLAAVATLRDRGVEDVVAIDLSKHRLEIARRLGARETVDASSENPWKQLRRIHGEATLMGAPMAGTNAFIEASGAGSVIPAILQHARGEARLAVVALHDQPVSVSFLLVMMKQLTIRGAMEYPEDYTETLSLLSRWDLSPMISHRYPLDRFPDALAKARDAEAAGKVMIQLEGGDRES